MSSRSKRILEMCQTDENRTNKISKENTIIVPDYLSDKKNNQIHFNIIDLPMDIITDVEVNDRFF